MPIVAKHRLESTGTYSPRSSRVARANSFSNATSSRAPRSASRSAIRLRKPRWSTGATAPSSVSWSTSIAPVFGAYGSTRNVSGSGTRRISPTGPMAGTGWRWSSPFIACIATVSPIPARMRPSSPCRDDAFARTVPSLPHHRKRTRRSPSFLTRLTTGPASTSSASAIHYLRTRERRSVPALTFSCPGTGECKSACSRGPAPALGGPGKRGVEHVEALGRDGAELERGRAAAGEGEAVAEQLAAAAPARRVERRRRARALARASRDRRRRARRSEGALPLDVDVGAVGRDHRDVEVQPPRAVERAEHDAVGAPGARAAPRAAAEEERPVR